MTTSKRISLLFAGYVTLLILVFGVIVNTSFFLSWYRIIGSRTDNKYDKNQTINIVMSAISGNKNQIPDFHDIKIIERINRPMRGNQEPLILTDQELAKQFSQRKDIFDFVSYNNQIWHYTVSDDTVTLTSVDGLIDSQFLLIYITLICTLLLAILSYVVSLWLVKSGLSPLYKLTHHIKQVQDPEEYENLVVGPVHDELQEVSSAFTHAMETIAHQTKNLKQFVSHASHELKTPLMAISSAVDVLKKKGDDSQQLHMIKETTQNMKYLIDCLMKTMRQDKLTKQEINIIPIVVDIIDQEKLIHKDAKKQLKTSYPESLVLWTDELSFESLVKNLISNAYKYGQDDSLIELNITPDKMILSNTISKDQFPDMDMIREPFYRADESRTDGSSHGLGLTIVRQTVERLGWTISAKLDDNRITFTLIWSE